MTEDDLIRTLQYSFFRQWNRLRSNDFTRGYFSDSILDKELSSQLKEFFFIRDMLNSVNNELRISTNADLADRYQRFVLRSLAGQFAFILYEISQEGRFINNDTIVRSQKLLKSKGSCPIHPCS